MRQKNREIVNFDEIIEVMRHCNVCSLALNDEEFPYIVPLNFGLDVEGKKVTLYFHSALEGCKVDLIKKDNRASFEMDWKHQLQYIEEKGYCTMFYESVIGSGKIRILEEDEKLEGLKKIMRQYHPEKEVYFNTDAISRTLVYALEVEKITGKRKVAK